MPKFSFYKNSNGTILPIAGGWGNKGVHAFLKRISLKVDVIAQMEFEFAYYVIYYATRIPSEVYLLNLLYSMQEHYAGIHVHSHTDCYKHA